MAIYKYPKLPKTLWRIGFENAIESVRAWMMSLSAVQRAAIFGALEDEWCHACGQEHKKCKCNHLPVVDNKKQAKMARSTESVFEANPQ
jgi:hypothetical protein